MSVDLTISQNQIKNRIHTLHGVQVMPDSDLAEIYQVETRVLNQAVKRNPERFPDDFMFQITQFEWDNLKSQNVISRLEMQVATLVDCEIKNIDTKTYDLSVKNPNKKDETALRQPKEILMEMKELDKESAALLIGIEELI